MAPHKIITKTAFLALLVIGCRQASTDWYQELGRKSDNGNQVIVCYVGKSPNHDSIAEFCREKKKVLTGRISCVVFFDSKDSFRMSRLPPTSAYEPVDDYETELSRHIVAKYTYNAVNGFSELSFKNKTLKIN